MRLFDEGEIESGKEILNKQAEIMVEKAQTLNDTELLEESQLVYKQLENFEYS